VRQGTHERLANLLVRIASTTTPGAKTEFAAETKSAKGTVVTRSTDGQGGATTIETDPYYGGPVSGLGDEAFCTTLNGTGAIGVLVRCGDRLLYASVGGTTRPPAYRWSTQRRAAPGRRSWPGRSWRDDDELPRPDIVRRDSVAPQRIWPRCDVICGSAREVMVL
jgi:hypothetical protein